MDSDFSEWDDDLGVTLVREGDFQDQILEARGHNVVYESWRAELKWSAVGDELEFALQRASSNGYTVWEIERSYLLDLRQSLAGHRYFRRHEFPRAKAATGLNFAVVDSLAHARIFAAFGSGRLVGFAGVVGHGDSAEVATTTVTGDAHGRGVGAAVVAAAIVRHAEEGHEVFTASDDSRNTASLQIALSLGFEVQENWRIRKA